MIRSQRKQQEGNKRKELQNRKKKKKTNKMAIIDPYLPIVTLNVNRLN